MGETKGNVIRMTTAQYLSNLDVNNPPPPATIEKELLQLINNAFDIECSMMPKGHRWKQLEVLTSAMIADIIVILHNVCRISCAGIHANAKHDLLAIYQNDGPDKGIYVEATDIVFQLTSEYDYNISENGGKEVLHQLRIKSKRKSRCLDPDLVAVNNGIFNYKTKQLQPFDPELVFLSKSYVDYNPNAQNIVLHNDDDDTDWNVEDWMNDLSDDEEIVHLLWEILGAIIRPNVKFNRSAWFYSEEGNNGKGSICELMRNLCGEASHASIQISDFGKEFLLEELTHVTAIIVDENEVNTYIDKAAKLKAVVTGDLIQINRKFKAPIAYRFKGFMVQCINGFPKVKDKSDSFYRRQLFIPFNKCFTGTERTYIKDVYLKNQDVLEYVLFKVLNMNYYKLSDPDGCKAVLDEYKEFNDPVRQFFNEFEDVFVWDLLPFTFLHELYLAWYKQTNPSGTPQGRNMFINDLLNGPLKTSDLWYCHNKSQPQRSSGRMNKPEHLIFQYDLNNWKNPTYRGNDTDVISSPTLNDSYRGVLRDLNYIRNNDNDDDNTDDNTTQSM